MKQRAMESWIRLNLIPGLGPVRIRQLLEYFSTPQRILSASREELEAVPHFGPALAETVVKEKERVKVDEELKKISAYGVNILTIGDKSYPKNLKEIYAPPPVLYVKGEILPEDFISVAVVGTRRCTAYGRTVSEKLSRELASRGITVVSGLARGIDTSAHLGALKGGGRTIAVLGTGIDICFPRENRELFDEIARRGAVVSEFPFSTGPEKGNFPRRNRCISGFSLGVVVVEAPERSGALITANLALEQGREVFAVPGNIFSSRSRGTHSLIQEGAKLVHRVEDIVDELKIWSEAMPLSPAPISGRVTISKEEQAVYEQLTHEPVHIDILCQETRLPIHQLSRIMSSLEMKGAAVQIGQKLFIKGVQSG